MIDIYGERVADAAALIREFAKTEYFHYFSEGGCEQKLEAFVAMMDAEREAGRQEERETQYGIATAELRAQDAARIAELTAQVAELRGARNIWIDIKDQIPEKDRLVWCARNDGRVHLAKRRSDLPLANKEPWQDCYWWDEESGNNWSDITVLAWSVVPERIRPAAPAAVKEGE